MIYRQGNDTGMYWGKCFVPDKSKPRITKGYTRLCYLIELSKINQLAH